MERELKEWLQRLFSSGKTDDKDIIQVSCNTHLVVVAIQGLGDKYMELLPHLKMSLQSSF